MGIVQIKKTKNNLFIVLRDFNNKLLSILSFGSMGFKADSKKTYYAYYRLAEKMGLKILEFKLKELIIEFLGLPLHIKAFISKFEKLAVIVESIIIKDFTTHGGCRFKKRRRK
jgi:ribosomal protein S11